MAFTFIKSVDPDEMQLMLHFIWVFTVSKSALYSFRAFKSLYLIQVTELDDFKSAPRDQTEVGNYRPVSILTNIFNFF